MASLSLSLQGRFINRNPTMDVPFSVVEKNLICQSFLKQCKGLMGYHIDIGTHHPYLFSNKNQSSPKGWQRIAIEPAANAASLIRLFSCEDRKDLNKQKQQGPGPCVFPIIKTINFIKTPLTEILDNNLPAGQTLEFLSVDVEGLNLRTLTSNNWNKYRPMCVIVKSGRQAGSGSAIYNLLKRKNYKQVFETPGLGVLKLMDN